MYDADSTEKKKYKLMYWKNETIDSALASSLYTNTYRYYKNTIIQHSVS